MQDGQRPTKRAKTQTPTRSNVATIIGMDRVTPRAIAYVAVQVSITKIAITRAGSHIHSPSYDSHCRAGLHGASVILISAM